MLIAREGPKLKDTETSAVSHWACKKICSLREKHKVN